MRYSIVALFALVSSALAQTDGFNVLTKPATGEKVPAGKTYTVVWTPNSKWPGPVTLTLMGGVDNTKLQLLDPIAKGVDGDAGEYEWDVPKSLGKQNVYGIKLSWDEDPENTYQYSFPFSIVNGGASSDDDASVSVSATSGSGSATMTVSNTGTTLTPTSTPASNASFSTVTRQSSFSLAPSSTGPAATTPSTSTTAINTPNAAPTIGSTLALFGGLAMAVFAL